ncbi:hypothetical protein DENSPDRAFT_776052, partial [Dentipellis sp. KUC8613]
MQVAGLNNLFKKANVHAPDLIVSRSAEAVPEYGNPSLFPGMFPTLYPYAVGGFEVRGRKVAVSMRDQADYSFDLHDRAFRYHYSYMFVVLNIIQRRTGHLQAYFTVQRSKFLEVADEFRKLDCETVKSTAKRIETEGFSAEPSREELVMKKLLNEVRTVSAKVPGSAASKVFVRNEIRSYMGMKGMPQIFLTINPNPHHSPIFQVMAGDETVDLGVRFPQLAAGPERARRLAKDPVAAADFFDFSIKCIFECLFGWDYGRNESSERGGILGHLDAFYGTAE